MPALTPFQWFALAAVAALGVWRFLHDRKRPAPLTTEQIKDLRRKGALILDVRSPAEYAQGHVKGSLNIPLGELPGRLGELRKDKAILACCASGMRSGRAVGILARAGFAQVHNVGPWTTLKG